MYENEAWEGLNDCGRETLVVVMWSGMLRNTTRQWGCLLRVLAIRIEAPVFHIFDFDAQDWWW